MDTELSQLLRAASEADETFDWSRLARALQRRGYPAPVTDPAALDQLRQREHAVAARTVEQAPQLLAAEAQRLFAAHAELQNFAWNQYSPHWCDGETCNFNAYLRYASVNDRSEYDDEGEALRPLITRVREVLATFDDNELMLALFGECSTVRVTREGIFREYYEHE